MGFRDTNSLTTRIPIGAIRFDFAPQTLLHVGQGIVVRLEHLTQQGDVRYGQSQGVDLAETLFVRKGGHVDPQLVEGGIDATARRKKKSRRETKECSLVNQSRSRLCDRNI